MGRIISINGKAMAKNMKDVAKTMKLVGYDLPKTIMRRTMTNANVKEAFAKKK